MKNWSEQIDTYTETQFGLNVNQLFGAIVMTVSLMGLLNVIHQVYVSLSII